MAMSRFIIEFGDRLDGHFWEKAFTQNLNQAPRNAHDFTGFLYVAEFFSQIEQTGFVFDNGIGSMKHESYLVFCIRIRHPYQNR